MTAERAPGQAGTSTEGSAGHGPARETRQSSRLDDMVRYGVWLAVVTRSLGDRRFQASVITAVIGAYALASLVKNNQARPLRRVVRWYDVKGEVHDGRVLHGARRAVKPGRG